MTSRVLESHYQTLGVGKNNLTQVKVLIAPERVAFWLGVSSNL